MKLLRAVFALALLFPVCAYAQKNKTTLQSEITTSFPDNTTGQITPSVVRGVFSDFVTSWQQAATVNPQAGTTYAIQTSDYGKLITFNNVGAVAVSLSAANSVGFNPFNVFMVNLGAGTVTVTPTTSTINGSATLALATNQSGWIVSDGTNYQVWQSQASVPAGVAANVLNDQTASYPIVSTDCGKTINIHGGYFTVTLPAVGGFSGTCVVTVKNADSTRAKLLSGFPADITNVRLWPLQTIQVGIINGAWATLRQPGRWLFPANQTIFVDSSASGKDDTTVDGLSNGSAFHTSPFAYGVDQKNFDHAGQFLTTESQVQNSTTLSAGNTYIGPLTGCPYSNGFSAACYVINGNGIGTTTISSSTAALILFFVHSDANIQVQNMAIGSSGTGASGVFVCATSGYIGFSTVNFLTTGNNHVDVAGPRCTIEAIGNYTISGGVNIHAIAEDEGYILLGKQATIVGTPAWGTAFAQADLKGFIEATGFTFSGAGATGKRCQAISQGTIYTNGGPVGSFFPGNSNCTADAATFGYYN